MDRKLPTQKDTQQKTCLNHQDERELHLGKNKKHASTGILHTHSPNPAFHLSYVGLSLTACVFHNLHSFCYKWNLIRYNKKEESPDGSVIKNPPAMRETWAGSLGWGDPLENEMATQYSIPSILAWEIPKTEEPGGLQSRGSQRVGQNLATKQQKQQERNICSGHIFQVMKKTFFYQKFLFLLVKNYRIIEVFSDIQRCIQFRSY